MTELPPDLARLRVVETYLLVQLQQVREAIRLAEQREKRQDTEGRRARRQAEAAERLRRRRQSEAEALASGDPDDRPGGPGRALGAARTPSPRGSGRAPHQGGTPGTARDDAVKWWHVEPAQASGPTPHPAYLHRGDCPRHRGDGRPGFTRDEARAALADQPGEAPAVRPCPHCRPDFGLA